MCKQVNSLINAGRPAGSARIYDEAPPGPETFTYDHYGPDGLEGRLSILPANHSPALQIGLDLLPQRPLVLFGISPGNAFFTRKRVEVAICGMAQLFGEVTIVVPDTIGTHTYRALGLSEEKARTKARKEGLNIKNRCMRAMERALTDNPTAKLQLLDWENDIATLPGYRDTYAYVSRLFDTNPDFRQDVLAKGYEVLSKKIPEASITPTAVREGVEYLLKEFAYMMLSRDVFGRDLVIPYHQDFALGHRFCDGTYHAPLHGIGWLIFDIDMVAELSTEAV